MDSIKNTDVVLSDKSSFSLLCLKIGIWQAHSDQYLGSLKWRWNERELNENLETSFLSVLNALRIVES